MASTDSRITPAPITMLTREGMRLAFDKNRTNKEAYEDLVKQIKSRIAWNGSQEQQSISVQPKAVLKVQPIGKSLPPPQPPRPGFVR